MVQHVSERDKVGVWNRPSKGSSHDELERPLEILPVSMSRDLTREQRRMLLYKFYE